MAPPTIVDRVATVRPSVGPSPLRNLCFAMSLAAMGIGCAEDGGVVVQRPPPPPHGDVYSLANGCFVLDATAQGSSNTRWLTQRTAAETYGFTATTDAAGTRFTLRASDLGTYLLRDPSGGVQLRSVGLRCLSARSGLRPSRVRGPTSEVRTPGWVGAMPDLWAPASDLGGRAFCRITRCFSANYGVGGVGGVGVLPPPRGKKRLRLSSTVLAPGTLCLAPCLTLL